MNWLLDAVTKTINLYLRFIHYWYPAPKRHCAVSKLQVHCKFVIHEGYRTDGLLHKTFFIVAEKISFPKLL